MYTYPVKLFKRRKEQHFIKGELNELGRKFQDLFPLLLLLDRAGWLLSDHVGYLAFGDRRKGVKAANLRLQRLFNHGLITSFRLSRSGMAVPGGSSPLVHQLTREGAQLLAAFLDVPITELHWHERLEAIHAGRVLHRLDIADLHCAVATVPGCQLTEFVYEPRYQLPKGGDRELRVLSPDALATWSTLSGPVSLLVEVDRGTERPRVFAERAHRYEAWYVGGEHERVIEGTPTVLVVVTQGGPERVEALRKATEVECRDLQYARYRWAWMPDLYGLEHQSHGNTPKVWNRFGEIGVVRTLDGQPAALL